MDTHQELIELLQKADQNEINKFLSKNKSNLKIMENIERNQFDYSWLDKIEETIEHFDKVIRNPRKFIAQEEEIVPVEKAKKISLETIKHLAQHTNLIQDVDEDGTITPSSVLNIHKEESYDIYENRFIKSLLDNLGSFIYLRKKQTAPGSSSKIERTLTYDGETQIDDENIKVSINLETKSHKDLVERSPLGLSTNERIERIELILADFHKSPFIKDLANALPVKSPIRKTNVFLKNQDFKKLLALWEFIERYEVTDVQEASGDREVTDKEDITNKMDMSFFLDYAILNTMASNKEELKTAVNKYYLQKMINDFINSNIDMDEKSFKKLLIDEFKKARRNKLKLDKELRRIINQSIRKYQKIKKESLQLLR